MPDGMYLNLFEFLKDATHMDTMLCLAPLENVPLKHFYVTTTQKKLK